MSRVVNLVRELPTRLRRITTGGLYRPEVDGLRFWAIAPVVLWHGIQRVSRAQPGLSGTEESLMLWVPEARVGVTLFLVISGFIIASQFIRARDAGREPNLGAYFYRRVTRIEPPYLLVLLVTYLFLTLTHYTPENARAFWRGDESLTSSLLASLFYLHGAIYNQMPRLFPGGWSLEVEVQFYILAPAIFALFYLAPSARSRLTAGLMILVVAFAASRYCEAALGPAGPHRYTLIKYYFYFWLGALIAEIQQARLWPRFSARAWDCPAFVGLGAYLWTGVAEHSTWWPIPDGLLDSIRVASFFFMFAGAMKGSVFAKLCTLPWITLIGGACYSIYLTHVQVMQLVTPRVVELFQPSSLLIAALWGAALMLPLVLAVGLAFYAFVERPFMVPRWPEIVGAWIRTRFGKIASAATQNEGRSAAR